MKYIFPVLLTCFIISCSHGDKQREDFPDMTQPDAREANELIIDQNKRDTMTTPDTTPGVVKPPAE